ncbi:protein phosphatase 2C 6 [Populus alba x Populus x berolinensis]|uniref:Protein phosphatase 2C 6 n=1 Tax=Populus alba x Populus x berolinensis TaxID=444605 RepID=A0AAD6WKE4_9ROSI|nr:protein phosphatase 2C 6 [Populus alba x Populus x berolinensis]
MGSCFSIMGKKKKKKDTDDDPLSLSSSSITSTSHLWKKRSSSSATNANADPSVLLHIPGRLTTNGATKLGCLYTQQGKKGTNQDAMLFWENFSSTTNDTLFCGVFDGHGPYGHLVAKKVRDSLPLILSTRWNSAQHSCLPNAPPAAATTNSDEAVDDESFDSLEVDETGKQLPDMYLPLKKSLLKAFKLMDKELKLHPTIDCFCSGTTAVTLIKQGQDLVIGNVGEAARILQCKGRVFALQDEPEVPRVWLPNNDSPGLAMARAFGDFCLKDFGLISVPDVYYRCLTERDEFIILASDGVWDVLSNKEAVDIVASAPGRATAARALVDCAVRAWRLKYPTSKNDDCAVVCLFLEHLCAANGEVEEQDKKKILKEPGEHFVTNENVGQSETQDDSCGPVFTHSSTTQNSDEIVPVSESMVENPSVKCLGQSKRSLAECISTAEDEEWSALEGITRVNSLLSLPRLLAGDKRSASWRKWI